MWRCETLLCPSLSSSFPPLHHSPSSARPKLLKLPASSCCYEPRGFYAALWGRSHALPKRKKGRKTAITVSEPQKKWEKHAWFCPTSPSRHLRARFCPFKTKQLGGGKMSPSFAWLVGNIFFFFLLSGHKFSLFFRGGGVAEVVRKLETDPPTVEVSQPGI